MDEQGIETNNTDFTLQEVDVRLIKIINLKM